eukprot:TRINITY_DN469_c0_g2_i4.p1 TRINITY_DN469_c0_g2~~TRINITY_DN469_c0_g2_i4.p1  ORF type:complete len:265 (+),score=31.93 TRINITY_DN469_c0_g2_i4:31-825(+)
MSQEGCNLGCALQGYRTIALNRFQLYRLIGTRCDKVATLQVLSRDPSVVLIPTASQPHRTMTQHQLASTGPRSGTEHNKQQQDTAQPDWRCQARARGACLQSAGESHSRWRLTIVEPAQNTTKQQQHSTQHMRAGGRTAAHTQHTPVSAGQHTTQQHSYASTDETADQSSRERSPRIRASRPGRACTNIRADQTNGQAEDQIRHGDESEGSDRRSRCTDTSDTQALPPRHHTQLLTAALRPVIALELPGALVHSLVRASECASV